MGTWDWSKIIDFWLRDIWDYMGTGYFINVLGFVWNGDMTQLEWGHKHALACQFLTQHRSEHQNHSILSGLCTKPSSQGWLNVRVSKYFDPTQDCDGLRKLVAVGTKLMLVGWISATDPAEWTSPVEWCPCTPWAGSHLHLLRRGAPNAEIGSLLGLMTSCDFSVLQTFSETSET